MLGSLGNQSRTEPEIIRHDTPGNVLYSDPGKPCPRCKCFFSSSVDFDLHQRVCMERDWRKSSYDDGEICPANKRSELAHTCIVNGGTTKDGLYTYSLSKNKRWLKRKKI